MSLDSNDVDEIEDDDLIEECINRFGGDTARTSEIISRLREHSPDDIPFFEIKTLDDQIKLEHIHKVFDKYTSAQLEQLIPEI